ncbi:MULTISPECIES: hypothetical protein [Pseudomonas]|uniref:hypothetical protein n=1 Tax=Pseudomonas TaxID=286 RepID=UPI00083DEB64|nr:MULTISPECIES: hypothetical protein [Pseudomonas]ODB37972.1 hypothetical protein A9L43_21220 [Pseudomonas mosselii]
MIHQLIQMIQSVQHTPNAEVASTEVQARRQGGLTEADLASLSMSAYQLRQAREAALASAQSAQARASVEQYTLEVGAGSNAASTRRQHPGSSLGINT